MPQYILQTAVYDVRLTIGLFLHLLLRRYVEIRGETWVQNLWFVVEEFNQKCAEDHFWLIFSRESFSFLHIILHTRSSGHYCSPHSSSCGELGGHFRPPVLCSIHIYIVSFFGWGGSPTDSLWSTVGHTKGFKGSLKKNKKTFGWDLVQLT